MKYCSHLVYEGIKYKPVLLKLTGEMFGGKEKKGLDYDAISKFSFYFHNILDKTQIQLATVVGAGRLFRGRHADIREIYKSTAFYIEMLGTIMNTLALQEKLEKFGGMTRVISPFNNIGFRDVYKKKTNPSFRKRKNCNSCRRDWQSFFYHRYRCAT